MLEVEDELTTGLTQLNTRLYGWWRIAVSGRDEAEATTSCPVAGRRPVPAQGADEHPEAQCTATPLASSSLANPWRRRRTGGAGSVIWAAAGVLAATASVGDRRGIMLGETRTATRRPVAWGPVARAQEVRRVRPDRDRRRPGVRQVLFDRFAVYKTLPPWPAGRRARPVRPAVGADLAAGARAVLPALSTCCALTWHPSTRTGSSPSLPDQFRRRRDP
ncbi:hypothetical protein HBB16_05710 [Pseudonocardia sp. MCCB 268]|nr:hypothetical protein [Pseudonocardia cytotoxica]